MTRGRAQQDRHLDPTRVSRVLASLKRNPMSSFRKLAPLLERYEAQHFMQEQMALALNRRGVLTPRGKKGTWTQGRVSPVFARLQSKIERVTRRSRPPICSPSRACGKKTPPLGTLIGAVSTRAAG